jgi:hypothetical protein|tara:strand:- start:2056 stop:2358 length:303 start_codon:yes stop_codon:yes gene_type:complete
MNLFKKRLERYEELIKKGDINGAIKRMKIYDREMLRMYSVLGTLFERIKAFDINMKIAIQNLEKGNSKYALEMIDNLKKKELQKIHKLAVSIAKQEIKWE